MKTLYFSLLVSVCLFWGSTFAAKTLVDVDNLPPSYESSTIQDWINLLEQGGHLVNVPRDMVALWRGRLRDVIYSGHIIKAIEVYNTVDPKPYAEIKTEFHLRGEALPEEHYEILLEFHRTWEQYGDSFWLDELENYKKRLAFLDTLTDEQWDYLGPLEVADFTDPNMGYELEGFKELVGAYIPMVNVPAPVADFASFYVFANLFENTWPILLVADNGKGGWDVQDKQGLFAELQFKFVADDGMETVLKTTDFGTGMYANIERDMFFIPPQSGRLWYRYVNFCVVENGDLCRDGDWAGNIPITHGHLIYGSRNDAVEISAGNNPVPTVPMAYMGDPNWDIEAYFSREN